MPAYIVTRATKATTNHHVGNPTTFISSRMCFVRRISFKNWILEILLCWNRRFHMHGRVSSTRLCLDLRLSQCGRSLFGLAFLLLLRLLGSNVLRTFFVVLWRKRLRRRVKSRMPRRGGRKRRTSSRWSLLFVHGRCKASAGLNNKCKQKIVCTINKANAEKSATVF